MMLDYHRVACLGISGRTPYRTHPHASYKWSNDAVVRPGKFRHDHNVVLYSLPTQLSLLGWNMEDLREMTHGSMPSSPERLRTYLGQYYWKALKARPFVFVNNSILMEQIIFISLVNGLEGHEHGLLDIRAAWSEEATDFLPHFINWSLGRPSLTQ